MKKGNLKTLKRVRKNYKNKSKMKKKNLLMALFLGVSLMSSNAATLNVDQDCFMTAWDYGTRMAENDRWDDNSEYIQWYYTDQFYRDYCE